MRPLNFDKFNKLTFVANDYDMVMLTERWLSAVRERERELLHTCNRGKKRKGGGVAVHARSSLAITKLCDHASGHMSAHWLLSLHTGPPP